MKIDNIIQRTDDIAAAAKAFFSARLVSDNLLQNFDDYTPEDLVKGVVCIVSDSEGNYKTGLGMEAKEGTQRLKFICWLKVEEKKPKQPKEIQRAEQVLMEEIKSFVKAGVAGMGLALVRVTQSRQLSYPLGWVVADIEAGPPGQTIN